MSIPLVDLQAQYRTLQPRHTGPSTPAAAAAPWAMPRPSAFTPARTWGPMETAEPSVPTTPPWRNGCACCATGVRPRSTSIERRVSTAGLTRCEQRFSWSSYAIWPNGTGGDNRSPAGIVRRSSP